MADAAALYRSRVDVASTLHACGGMCEDICMGCAITAQHSCALPSAMSNRGHETLTMRSAHIRIHMWMHMRMHMCIHMRMHIHAYVLYPCVYPCVYTCAYPCEYPCVHVYTHAHAHVDAQACMRICLYACVCILNMFHTQAAFRALRSPVRFFRRSISELADGACRAARG